MVDSSLVRLWNCYATTELIHHLNFLGRVLDLMKWINQSPNDMQHITLDTADIAPDFRQALTLKKTVEDRIAKDGVIGIGITATAVGLIAGGIAAALARKK
ncbi:Mitochondrial fission 1 protein A [Vitis vinifera]|uniref:Mitochondrial fission 1 protein A n=1 Tax=Vitis vinifera TaxID=29760 RepID=A0A438I6H5_VITVI|nr:Mitochondrial fission 1 protein A [Vitis vinifera]